MDWPKYSEYFTGATFCVAVDSLNGLVYVAQVSKIGIFFFLGYGNKENSFPVSPNSVTVYVYITPIVEFVF